MWGEDAIVIVGDIDEYLFTKPKINVAQVCGEVSLCLRVLCVVSDGLKCGFLSIGGNKCGVRNQFGVGARYQRGTGVWQFFELV